MILDQRYNSFQQFSVLAFFKLDKIMTGCQIMYLQMLMWKICFIGCRFDISSYFCCSGLLIEGAQIEIFELLFLVVIFGPIIIELPYMLFMAILCDKSGGFEIQAMSCEDIQKHIDFIVLHPFHPSIFLFLLLSIFLLLFIFLLVMIIRK